MRLFIPALRVSVLAVLFLVVTQDFQICPALLSTKTGAEWMFAQDPSVESIRVATADGETIEVWRMAPRNSAGPLAGHAAVFCRGNGGPLGGFLGPQRWLADLGATAYIFNYRGVGNSSGWPSEEGFARDADAVWSYVREREKLEADRLVVVGMSLGTGPASRLAAAVRAKLLILFSPYTNIPSAAASRPYIGRLYELLAPLIRYRLPTRDYVAELSTTCLIVAHGDRDGIIPVSHGREVASAYHGRAFSTSIFDPASGHNDVFWNVKDRVAEAILSCQQSVGQ